MMMVAFMITLGKTMQYLRVELSRLFLTMIAFIITLGEIM